METKMTVDQKLRKARSKLILHHPFFGTVVMKMPLIARPETPTYATDGERMFYNPALVEKESVEEVMAELAHEVMHVVLLHPWRMAGRKPDKWNIAGDYVINHILKESGFKMDDTWLFDHAGDYLYDDKDGNNKIMDTDKIYALIPNPPKGKAPTHVIIHPGIGGGNGEGKDGEKDGKSGKKGNQQSPGKSAKQAMSEAIVLTAQAAMVAKQCGKLPGKLSMLVENIVNPRIPWGDVLRRFIEQYSRDDYSWLQPSRRFIGDGIYIPSLLSRKLGILVVCVDTSGSVGKDEMEAYCGEISGILQAVDLELLYFLQCDSDIAHVTEYTKDDLPLKITRHGFGGTSFKPPFDWVDEQGITPAAFIYATDMECNVFPDKIPDYPVLWLASGRGCYDASSWPFGEVIDLVL